MCVFLNFITAVLASEPNDLNASYRGKSDYALLSVLNYLFEVISVLITQNDNVDVDSSLFIANQYLGLFSFAQT
jgi:hypothetical protein